MPDEHVSEREAETERKAIRKAIDETEAPTKVEIKEAKPQTPRPPAPGRNRRAGRA